MSVGGGDWACFYMSLLLILTTPGHTTIFELALLFDPIFMWLGFLFILIRLFVCLFVHTFIFFFFFFKRVTIQI